MNRKIAIFTLLYASEGAPIGFIWWALPTLLRADGVPIEQITALTAVLLLPWMLKFLWAPFLDLCRGPRWGYRAWIISMQTVMGAALVPLVWLDPVVDFGWWRQLLLTHAVAASTQDVAIDALAIGAVRPGARGRLNGAMQAGMLIGRSLFGGGVLLLGSWFGREWIVGALVAWILVALAGAAMLREAEPARAGRGGAFFGALAAAIRQPTTWIGLAFALVSAAAFEATGQLAGPFLVDRGVASATIGMFFGLLVVGAMLLGGLVGGTISDRWGRLRSAAGSLIGFVLMIVLLAVADLSGAGAGSLIALLTAMYFFVGFFTAVSYALFMDLTDARLGATQFSAFMAATNGCESWSAWTGGRIVAAQGYPSAFLVMSVVSLFGLPLLGVMRRVLARGNRAEESGTMSARET